MNTQTPRKQVSIRSLQHEILVAGILWVIFAAICVLAANAWAAGV